MSNVGDHTAQAAIQVTVKSSTITLEMLKDIIKHLLETKDSPMHGKQSVKKLNIQGKRLVSVDIKDDQIKSLRRQLNKYAVDFSIVKDKTDGTYTVFFKADDRARLYKGLEKSNEKSVSKGKDGGSIQKAIESAISKAAQRNQKLSAPAKNLSNYLSPQEK